MRKKLIPIFIIAACGMGALAPSLPAQVEKNTVCPVMPGTPVKDQFFVDYHGRRIYFCCAPCVKAFKRNPEKYLKNLEP